MKRRNHTIKTVDETSIVDKKVLLRVDFNVTLTKQGRIADDARITQVLPTITHLLTNKNKIILISHLGRPKKRDTAHSLVPVIKRLQKYLPKYKVLLVGDFESSLGKQQLRNQKEHEILILENIRFYEGEQNNDLQFAKRLAQLADVFVNDAFGVCHRPDASVVGIPKFLPSYAGLLLTKELDAIATVLKKANPPITAIVGGAKISTKIAFLSKLMNLADTILLGGALANTFLLAQNKNVGRSFVEKEELPHAKKLLTFARNHNKSLLLPVDVVGSMNGPTGKGLVFSVNSIPDMFTIYDVGPETQAHFAKVIHNSHTIIWNGPLGYCEQATFSRGTDFIYYSIAHATHAYSLVGGGDTLASISKKEYLHTISHVSTGGGAMLEFIEQGSLPGIEALKSLH